MYFAKFVFTECDVSAEIDVNAVSCQFYFDVKQNNRVYVISHHSSIVINFDVEGVRHVRIFVQNAKCIMIGDIFLKNVLYIWNMYVMVRIFFIRWQIKV